MQQECFLSSNGLTINFVPGWFEKKNVWHYGLRSLSEFVQEIMVKTITALEVFCFL